MDDKNEKVLVSVIIKNMEGVLSKISNICSDNDINIEKLTISNFESRGVNNQKAVMLLNCDSEHVNKMLKNLKKQKLIHSFYIFKSGFFIERELMLIKIKATNPKFIKITELFNEYKVENIYYVQGDKMIFQFCDNEAKNNELMSRLEKISSEVEILKSGMVALTIDNDMKN